MILISRFGQPSVPPCMKTKQTANVDSKQQTDQHTTAKKKHSCKRQRARRSTRSKVTRTRARTNQKQTKSTKQFESIQNTRTNTEATVFERPPKQTGKAVWSQCGPLLRKRGVSNIRKAAFFSGGNRHQCSIFLSSWGSSCPEDTLFMRWGRKAVPSLQS